MFEQLTAILRQGDTLALTISREPDAQRAAGVPADDSPQGATYRVNIMPKLFSLDGEHGADRLALNTPLTITGTAAELDSPEFIATLNRFAASVTTTRHTIEDVEATHQAALAAKKASKSAVDAKRSSTPAKKDEAKKPEPKSAAEPEPEAEPTEETEAIL